MDFCFRCHRVEENDETRINTVNAITFNSKHGTFATVGSDGNFTVWNKDTKSKYKSSKNPAPLPMTAACFSEDA
jgi:WD40 repeat protein